MSFRFTVLAAAGLLGLALVAAAPVSYADEQATYRFDLPAQPLADTLRAIARQTGANVLFGSKDLNGIRVPGLKGQLTASQAIERVLAGTQLQAERTTPTTVIVQPAAAVKSGNKRDSEGHFGRNRHNCLEFSSDKQDSSASLDESGSAENDCKSRNVQGNLALAGAEDAQGVTAAPSNDGESHLNSDLTDKTKIQEILVTAQKRQQNIQDVPVSITVLSPGEFETANLNRVEDYFTRVPGLSLVSEGGGAAQTIALRGITTGGGTGGIFAGPTVALVIDDISYGSSLGAGSGSAVIDVDPGDLQRIEVLRGPQGTLYGSNALGGLVKYVTKDPVIGEWAGSVQGGINAVHAGDDLGYSIRGSVNIPIGETLALRASGFSRWDPGFIDNVSSGETDVNSREAQGGKAALLWQPSQNFSLKLGALLQDVRTDGLAKIHSIPGVTSGFQQSVLPGTDTLESKTHAYSATANLGLGAVDIVSLTAYSIKDIAFTYDLPGFAPFLGGPAAALILNGDTKKFTQELRATVPIGDKVEWLVGGMFTNEDIRALEDYGTYQTDGESIGTGILLDTETNFQEYAAFTNLTYTFSDNFDVQVGGRFSRYTPKFSTERSGPLAAVIFPDLIVPEVSASDTHATYLITPRFRVSPDFMVYARFATGYRPGGPIVVGGLAGIPDSYGPDTTTNYEIGAKGALFDRSLTYDFAVYHIDWKDIQLQANNGVANYTANAGSAQSEGVELSAGWKSGSGLSISGWFAFNDAKLKEAFPFSVALGSAKGDRLPYSSRLSGNLSMDQEFSISDTLTGYVGSSASYVGDRKDIFRPIGLARATFLSYTLVDLTAGVRGGSWSFDVYLNNVGNEQGKLYAGDDLAGRSSSVIVQPRTIGASFTKRL